MKQRSYLGATDTFNFNEVLSKGYILYGWISASGQRIVSIEDPTSYHHMAQGTLTHKERTEKIAIGKGATIEFALKQALTAFEQGITHDRMYRNRLFSKRTSKGHGKQGRLDRWMQQSDGRLRAVQDADGTIMCVLEGLQTHDGIGQHLGSVHGWGPSFKSALADAFSSVQTASLELL